MRTTGPVDLQVTILVISGGVHRSCEKNNIDRTGPVEKSNDKNRES